MPDADPLAPPLPDCFLTEDHAGIGGRLKERAEDFVVDEVPAYEPCGEGEHLYLHVRKTDRPTLPVVRDVARHFGVPTGAVGYAGMKDKRAITTQWLSVHVRDDAGVETFDIDGVELLEAGRHGNKLRIGHLAGNRFDIRIRGVDPDAVRAVSLALERLRRSGVPNFFGEQRFGFFQNNHRVGHALLRREWERMCDLLLDPHRRERADETTEGLEVDEPPPPEPDDDSAWVRRRMGRAERLVADALDRGASPRDAILEISDEQLRFYVTAFQSALFNRILADRMAEGRFDRLEEGDLAWKHDSRAVFLVTRKDLSGPQLDRRLADLEISPSGPLWGCRMIRAEGRAGRHERRILDATGVTPEDFDSELLETTGTRRSLRMIVRDLDAAGGSDEHGPFIRIRFMLPRGAFATTVLREIMKTPAPERPWGST